MRTVVTLIVGVVALAAGMLGGSIAYAGEGHTPVVVCHWVPAHGGSFVTIVVDDDGANGNKNLRGHAIQNHANNIIGVPDCDDPGDPD